MSSLDVPSVSLIQLLSLYTAWSLVYVCNVCHLTAVHPPCWFCECMLLLRYGLPVNFQAMLLAPQKKSQKRLREVLNHLYGHLDNSAASPAGADVSIGTLWELHADHNYLSEISMCNLPSVLWRCWLGSRNGIRPVKKLSGGMLACLGWDADLHIDQQMPLPLTISCSGKSRLALTFLVFTFLVPAYPGGPGHIPEGQ